MFRRVGDPPTMKAVGGSPTLRTSTALFSKPFDFENGLTVLLTANGYAT